MKITFLISRLIPQTVLPRTGTTVPNTSSPSPRFVFALLASARRASNGHDSLLTEPQVERDMALQFTRYWVDWAQRFGGETLESYQNYDKMEQEWTNVYAGFNVLARIVHSQNVETLDADVANLVIALWGALRQFTLYAGRWDEKIQLSTLAYTVTSALSKWDDAG